MIISPRRLKLDNYSMMTIIGIILLIAYKAQSYNKELSLTPQMGWNSWNRFACDINQQLIKKTADRIVQLDLDKKGYKYVNLDDCWQLKRKQNGSIQEDFKQFPNGMSYLSNYIHSKGLKFGLYSDAGYLTCQKRPGGYGYQEIDALQYQKWEVDYLKYDNCYKPEGVTGPQRYQRMRNALNKLNRKILLSLCSWGEQKVWEWGNNYAQSWRTTGDISDNWDSFLKILDLQVGLEKYSLPGGWNDPDMLEVGNGNMKNNEYMAHFAFWCVLKAPLLIGCDLNNISQQTLKILGNEQLIAINQDSLGIQAKRIKSQIKALYKRQVWGGPLSNNKYVVVFFNRGHSQTQIDVDVKQQLGLQYSSYSQRDPIRFIDIPTSKKKRIIVRVEPHSVEIRILSLVTS